MAEDTAERVLMQVNVATTLEVVRVLSASLHNHLSLLDTCCLTGLLVCGSYLMGHENTLVLLSRRISLLLLVELLRPALAGNVPHGLSLFTHVQSLMANALVVSSLALAPAWWRATQEGEVVTTAVLYLYTNMFNFVAHYNDVRLATLMAAGVGLWAVSAAQKDPGPSASRLYVLGLEIVAVTLTNLSLRLLAPEGLPQPDACILYVALMVSLVYVASFLMEVARTTENYLVYAVANQVVAFVHDESWYWALGVAAVFLLLKGCLGPRVWVTQCSLLVFCQIVVAAALRYVVRLAANDEVVTLKAAALVLQYALHEVARRLHGDRCPL